MAVELSEFPRCKAYLSTMKINLNDSDLDEWQCAAILIEKWSDNWISKNTDINFVTMEGNELLQKIEKLLSDEKIRKPEINKKKDNFEDRSFQALLGSFCVRTSALKTDEDYRIVCKALWPFAGWKEDASYSDLRDQLRSMTKKERSTARKIICNLPVRFRARRYYFR